METSRAPLPGFTSQLRPTAAVDPLILSFLICKMGIVMGPSLHGYGPDDVRSQEPCTCYGLLNLAGPGAVLSAWPRGKPEAHASGVPAILQLLHQLHLPPG